MSGRAEVTVAACNYAFRDVADFSGFTEHVREVLDLAAGADVVVLPELLTFELITALPGWQDADDRLFAQLTTFDREARDLFEGEARSRRQYIVAGSQLVEDAERGMLNVSFLYGPEGLVHSHAKTHLFPAEWSSGTQEGDEMEAFDLPFARAGISICYETQFPECAASLVHQGAELLLVPSMTMTEAGWWRIRNCALARCIENQIYAVHSAVAGPARGPFPGSYARSAVLSPCDKPWPDDGILAQTEVGVDGVAIATLDFEALHEARRAGATTTYSDRRRRADRYAEWPSHIGAPA